MSKQTRDLVLSQAEAAAKLKRLTRRGFRQVAWRHSGNQHLRMAERTPEKLATCLGHNVRF